MNYLERYRESHRHPMNRLLHTVGIPTVVISILVLFWDWRWGLGLFVVGWVLQFAGHYYEGKPPAFFSNPVYLIVGPYWWVKKLFTKK